MTVVPGSSTDGSGPHGGCRINEFARYDRRGLEAERSYLSRVMANKAGLLSKQSQNLIMHDLTDIDYLLSELTRRGQ